MKLEKTQEKIELINDFYGNGKQNRDLPDDIQNYTFLKYFLEDGDTSLVGGSYFFNHRDELKDYDIKFEDLGEALKHDVSSFAEVIDQIFSAVKKLKDLEQVSNPKIIKMIWFWLFHRWSYVASEMEDKFPLQHIKFYLIASEMIDVKPISHILGVPDKKVLQAQLLSLIKYLEPNISKRKLERESGVDKRTIAKLESDLSADIQLAQLCAYPKEDARQKIKALKKQLG